jgi:uncharacterized RDD family membrane protein YckC
MQINPTASAVHYSYASFWRRLAAFLIDNALIHLPLMPFIFIYLKKSGLWNLIVTAQNMSHTLMADTFTAGAYMSIINTFQQYFIYFVLYRMLFVMLYHGIWEASKLQATPGKLAVRIIVTDINGNRLTLMRSCARNLCKALSNITLLIGYIMALVTENHQALHDKLTGCYVTKMEYDAAPVGVIEYAGFGRRLIAIILDFLLLGTLLSPLNLLLIDGTKSLSEIFNYNLWHPDTPIMPSIDELIRDMWVSLASTFIVFFYFASWESSRFQATPGKIAIGIRVTDSLGQRLSFWRAAGRYMNKYISNFTMLIGYAMAAFTPKKQALHDELADTLVIKSQVPK